MSVALWVVCEALLPSLVVGAAEGSRVGGVVLWGVLMSLGLVCFGWMVSSPCASGMFSPWVVCLSLGRCWSNSL